MLGFKRILTPCGELWYSGLIMNVITIPKKLGRLGDLVVIPRKEYEAFLELKKIREFVPTKAQKRSFKIALKNYKEGKTYTLDELKRKLDRQS